jgi:hypothetical protein
VTAFKVGAIQRYKLGGPKDKATATSGPDPREFKDDEGKFVFECLPDGEWELFVTCGEPVPAKTIHVTLPQAGEPITLIMPSFTEKQSLTGRVVDPQGKAVVGASVRAAAAAVGEGETAVVNTEDKFAKTDKDGVFRFEKLRKWPLQFSATAPGFGKSETLRLDGTESLSEIVLSLRPACKLTGDVVDANGQPVADCFVTADVEGQQLTRRRTADEDGQARTLRAHGSGTGANVVVAYTDDSHPAGELLALKRIVLAADAPATVKLKLKPPKK